jgi:pyruvate dehydrogenase E1 component alpha subunit
MPREKLIQFTVSRLQILAEDGTVDPLLEPSLSQEELIFLYHAMVLARESDQRMLKLQRQGRIGTFPLCTGQEAAACGAALAMRREDWLVVAFREVGAMLMRGVGLDQILALYAGWEEGNVMADAPRTLPISIPVGAQIPHAVGLAYASRALGEPETAAVAFFGDGATSEGDFHEALNFAALWKVPVVFVCLNNGWAISLPREQQTSSATIAQKAIAYGMEGVQVDGNDPLAVYQATTEALDRARQGGGPTLIEAVTYRLMMHTTSDAPDKYRAQEEVDQWWKREPLPRFRAYLTQRGIWSTEQEEKLQQRVKAEVDEAVRRFEEARREPPEAPFDHVLSGRHPALEEQRREFLARLERLGQREVPHG